MAAVLLAAGEKGKRIALPNAEIMIHQPLGGTQGQATDIIIHAEQILKTKDKLTKIIAQCSNADEEKVRQDMERDHYLSADEALEYGLIDNIIKSH